MDSDVCPGDGALGTGDSRQGVAAEDVDSYSLIEPPPLDWRSDCSSETDSADVLDDPGFPPPVDSLDKTSPGEPVLLPLRVSNSETQLNINQKEIKPQPELEDRESVEDSKDFGEVHEQVAFTDVESKVTEGRFDRSGDEDHGRIQTLLSQLQLMGDEPHPSHHIPPPHNQCSSMSELEACAPYLVTDESTETTGLLFSESHQRHLLGLLQCTEIGATPRPTDLPHRGEVDAVVSISYSQEDAQTFWPHSGNGHHCSHRNDSFASLPDDEYPEPVWMKLGEDPPEEEAAAGREHNDDDHPSYKDVPGPCDPDDLLDGVIFGAKYLGSTQLKSDRNPSTNARMAQAQEAVDRIKAPEGESQPMTEVDLFISTQRIKVLTADTQEAMMDHALQMISYIADIGNIVVLMARRKRKGQDDDINSDSQKKCVMICHVFSSEDAQVIAQAIGQAFGVAYQQFLQANGIKASDLRPGEYSDYLESQELYNGDLAHFSNSQNLKDVAITKAPGDILGLAVVESGWGSILPTVVVANLLHGGPAERCGELSIGDRIMSVNGTSLVGLPITTCQNIIRDALDGNASMSSGSISV
ncbi:amyloid-beta A4 precursor protein-binding family A member 3 isoform X2 [Betta splendens]|uniref:Amyloid-beta A4 precursor protein-binding family A member 3 isoform X2 n=1 Tax=Betta splendens TaxID=158456 RepID=A0A9W2XPP8_BETSP|nr:amyloid-beta A4 precursor protein-binding family A member 3 isoform X2 [Betta splendens]